MSQEIDNKKILEEIEELKKEIKLLKESINISPSKGSDFDFNSYKHEVNHEDLKKLMEFKKIKPIWFIPVIGFFWCQADIQINVESIDRGLVRSEYVKSTWILFIPLIPIAMISMFLNIWPFFEIYGIRKLTYKRMLKKKLVKNE
ncbi:MAG: hypothetical protein ACRC8C_01160 [Mycoplasmoidaceae bacterium]